MKSDWNRKLFWSFSPFLITQDHKTTSRVEECNYWYWFRAPDPASSVDKLAHITQEEKVRFCVYSSRSLLIDHRIIDKSKTLPPLSSWTFERQQLLHTWPKLKMQSLVLCCSCDCSAAAGGGGWHCSWRQLSPPAVSQSWPSLFSSRLVPYTPSPRAVSPHRRYMCTLFFARISTFSAGWAIFLALGKYFGKNQR